MWITLKLQFYKNRHNIWIVSLKLFFFTTNNWPICTSMYIKMCRPSSFNKTNEKNERNAEKISKITPRPTRTNIKFCLLSLFNHSTKKFSCSWNMKKIYWIKCYMLFPSKFSISHVKKRSLYTINSDKLQTPTMYKKWYDRWIYSSDMII